jgi:hypothetical protein
VGSVRPGGTSGRAHCQLSRALFELAISAKSTSTTPGDRVAVFDLAADGGTNAGLNVVSANTVHVLSELPFSASLIVGAAVR